MQLRVSTDYALRIIVYIAERNGITASTEIAKAAGISAQYTLKILRKLEQTGIVKSFRGIEGGYCLHKQPSVISLLDIMRVMEPTTKLNRCLEEDHYCSRNAVGGCPVHEFYKELQEQMETILNGITIQKIIEREIGRIEVNHHKYEKKEVS